MYLWDWLILQVEMTFNLLRQSRIAPKVSAYAYLHGSHDFNKIPLAPLGFAVQVHKKPRECCGTPTPVMDGILACQQILLRFPDLSKGNKGGENFRHGVLQAQIHHNANYDKSRHND
ncbi:hypothetical protein ACHAW6_005621 [Cyclotella cf. meneghiniana]